MSNKKTSKINKNRLVLIVILLSLFWLALEVNLFRLQIVNNDLFSKIAKDQYEKKITLPARKGAICDRNSNKLATNTIHFDLASDPKMVENKRLLALKCARAFSKSENYYLNILNQESRFEYLARKVPDSDIRDILKLNDKGLIKIDNFRRHYPYRTYAAQLLGFTDPDDRGLSGLELQYEEELKGKDGEAVLQYDGPRRVFYNADYPLRWPEQGMDIYLTLDKNIQTVVEQELSKGVKKMRAVSGMGIILDPGSGAVLAMASYPSFNPNCHNRYNAFVKKNRTITDAFEPGSTFKIFVAAALLQERLAKENDIVFCENGSYNVYGHYFSDTKRHGWLTFRKVIEKSSNIGMIKLSEKLPSNVVFRYSKNFGFGVETNIGLIGEASGILQNPKSWSGLSKASISIGQEIAVTAIQIVSAYAAVINGGYLYRPYVVSHLQTSDGKIRIVNKPEIVRQIISPEVSDILKSFMYGVVERGTGKKAKLNEIVVGGKTGTAQKINPKTGKYFKNKYVSSFIGFAPYNNPKYVCAIILNEPVIKKYGGEAAAPIFRNIIHRIIHFDNNLNLPEILTDDTDKILAEKIYDLPPMEGFKVETAISLLKQKNIKYRLKGKGSIVKNTFRDGREIIIDLGLNTVNSKRVPKLVGLSLRQALAKLDLSKFRVSLQGKRRGIVKKQSLPPGMVINKRMQLTLTCN